jgi:fatty-acid desaturase
MVIVDNLFFYALGLVVPGWTPLSTWYWLSLVPRFYTSMVANLTNSAGHQFGTRPYIGKGWREDCYATNCWWAALLGGGEGIDK